MKKQILLAMFAVCALFVGCTSDETMDTQPDLPIGYEEGDIIFGASAYSPDTRTEYGDTGEGYVYDDTGKVVDTVKLIEVNWVAGDQVQVACKQAVGTKLATYEVTGFGENTGGTDADGNKINYGGDHKATGLSKVGGVGLQWGTEFPHKFYAVYPAHVEAEYADDGVTLTNKPVTAIMDDEGLTGFLPLTQTPTLDANDSSSTYVYDPDMDYAYMVATSEVDLQAGSVGLNFTPFITALQFQLQAGEIAITGENAATTIVVSGVTLYSASGQRLCGGFNYKFDGGTCTPADDAADYSQVTVALPEPKVLSSGQTLDVTFFVLPTVTTQVEGVNDLKLKVTYTVGGVTQIKTATISKTLTPGYKHNFKNVKLPDHTGANVTGSSWIKYIDDATYVSQLSVPVAGHAFSSQYSGDNPQYYKEQVKSYTELWNMGVRGFEFRTSYGYADEKRTNTLEDEYFVCNGAEMTSGTTFGTAFKTLAGMMASGGTYADEFMVIVCTYKPHGTDGAYSPANYIADLEAFLTGTNSTSTDYTSQLAQLTSTTTVKDLRGKIAVVVRIGDDDYCRMLSAATTADLTSELPISIINNWGTSPDQWDKRKGFYTYLTEGAYAGGTNTKTEYVEKYLQGLSTTESGEFSVYTDTNGVTYPLNVAKYPTSTTDSCTYAYTVNKNASSAYVQCWERVMPKEWGPMYTGVRAQFSLGLVDSDADVWLWTHWPESLSEKKTMIDETLALAAQALGTDSSTSLVINSLCGFFPVESFASSYGPQATISGATYEGRFATYTLKDVGVSGAGDGGDWASCAAELNTYLYNKINAMTNPAPLGLIMFDYIGASASDFGSIANCSSNVTAATAAIASQNLTSVIVLNNFNFPLSTDPNVTEEDDKSDANTEGGEIIL